MSESKNWSFPTNLQPSAQDMTCDLDHVLDSVVSVRAEIPEDAFTASFLGTERSGSGVVISEDGLILTIGYLITEAQSIWLTANNGTVIQGHTLAYDQATGFGLIQPLGRLKLPMLPFASMASTEADDDVFVIASGGRHHALKAKVVGKREFAGNWEYVLDEAIFTAPAHPHWSGAALEAAPRVHISDPVLLAAFDGLDVADVFRTSQATLLAGDGPADAFRLAEVPGVAVEPLRAEGRKCARSWRVLPEVGSDPRYPDLSLRDADAVAAWDAAHA